MTEELGYCIKIRSICQCESSEGMTGNVKRDVLINTGLLDYHLQADISIARLVWKNPYLIQLISAQADS